MSDDLDREEPRRGRPRRRERDRDDGPPPPGGGAMKVVLIVFGIVAVFGLCLVAACGGLIYWGYQRAAPSRDKIYTNNNFRQISLAMLNYDDTNGRLPPVSMKTRD